MPLIPAWRDSSSCVHWSNPRAALHFHYMRITRIHIAVAFNPKTFMFWMAYFVIFGSWCVVENAISGEMIFLCKERRTYLWMVIGIAGLTALRRLTQGG